jgi:hypothetical protein
MVLKKSIADGKTFWCVSIVVFGEGERNGA